MTKIIKLYKNNCNPCTLVSNYLEYKGVKAEEYNIMENTDLAVKYGVMSVPVIILVDDEGNEIQRSTGFKPNEIDKLLDQLT